MVYTFARCKTNKKLPFQLFTQGSVFHFECNCGQKCSYDESNGLFKKQSDHLDKFDVTLSGSYFTNSGFEKAKQLLESNPESYLRET